MLVKLKTLILWIVIVVVLVLTAISNAFADEREYEREQGHIIKHCKNHAITTACDLKAYADSPVGGAAYAVFQGYVIGAFNGGAVPNNGTCVYNASDAQAILAVKQALSALPYW